MKDRGKEKLKCENKAMNGRTIWGAIKVHFNEKRKSLNSASVYKSLLMLTLMYQNKTKKIKRESKQKN